MPVDLVFNNYSHIDKSLALISRSCELFCQLIHSLNDGIVLNFPLTYYITRSLNHIPSSQAEVLIDTCCNLSISIFHHRETIQKICGSNCDNIINLSAARNSTKWKKYLRFFGTLKLVNSEFESAAAKLFDDLDHEIMCLYF